jgi:hypothetical protein
MGSKARQAHQEDVFTSLTDTQNELLCRAADGGGPELGAVWGIVRANTASVASRCARCNLAAWPGRATRL